MSSATLIAPLPRLSKNGGPLYLQIAERLQRNIASGRYAVGSLLPTEHELSDHFGVSRQTVRQAILHLRQMRLISARKGIGTRVEARDAGATFSHSVRSLSELAQYAEETVLHVRDVKPVVLRGELAATLGRPAGETWLRLSGPRMLPGEDAPFCWTTTYLDRKLAGNVSTRRSYTHPIWRQIEQEADIRVREVRQSIAAKVLGRTEAARLQRPAGSAALEISRCYVIDGGVATQLSISLHPADRFRYESVLKRDCASI